MKKISLTVGRGGVIGSVLLALIVCVGAGALSGVAQATPAENWDDLRLVIHDEIMHIPSRQVLLQQVDMLQMHEMTQDWDSYEMAVTFFVDELIQRREDMGTITWPQEVAVYTAFSEVTQAYVAQYNLLSVTETRVIASSPNERCINRRTATCGPLTDRTCHIKAEFRNGVERNRRCETE